MIKLGIHSSFESVAHRNNYLFLELKNIILNARIKIREIKEQGSKADIRELLIKNGLDKFIGKFGFENTDLKVISGPGLSAYSDFHSVNSSHFDDVRRLMGTSVEMEKLIQEHKNEKDKLLGYIDRKNMKVSGVFSKIKCYIKIGEQHLTKDDFTVEESAALILHEIGHLWDAFEYMISETYKNHVLHSIKQIRDPNTKESAVRLVLSKETIKDLDAEKIMASESGLEAIVFRELDNEMRSELPFNVYSDIGNEQLADEFSIKMGSQEHLATALHKFNVLNGDISLLGSSTYFFIETVRLTAATALLFVAPVIAILGLAVRLGIGDVEKFQDTYDRPKDRLIRIRQELVNRISTMEMSNSEKREVLRAISTVKELENKYTNRDSIFNKMARLIDINSKAFRNSRKEQKLLEELASNELHVLAAKLETF